jgi:hypothetical protein
MLIVEGKSRKGSSAWELALSMGWKDRLLPTLYHHVVLFCFVCGNALFLALWFPFWLLLFSPAAV